MNMRFSVRPTFTLLFGAICHFAAVAFIFSVSLRAQVGQQSAPPTPQNLRELLALDAGQIEQCDVALLNLLAAEGLRGAENLNVADLIANLDAMARRVESETRRNFHRFLKNPAEFNSSEAYFRTLFLIVIVQEDFRIRYNPERISSPDSPEPEERFYANANDVFISGLLGPSRMGTCASMPVYYVAVGRKLGYPLKLVMAKSHLFARWDTAKERFNIEATNRGLNTPQDDHYRKWPLPISDAELATGIYLKSLTPAEELSSFLENRSLCLKVQGRFDEAAAALTFAQKLTPHWSDMHASHMRSLIRAANVSQASENRGPYSHAEADALIKQSLMQSYQMQLSQWENQRRAAASRGQPPPPKPQPPNPILWQ